MHKYANIQLCMWNWFLLKVITASNVNHWHSAFGMNNSQVVVNITTNMGFE